MMRNLFIEILQMALGTRERLSRVPNGAEWIALRQESQRQAVLGLMVEGLELLPKEQRPPKELLLQWIGQVQMNESSYQLHCERARELTIRLEAAGYNSCILKGIGTAQLYPVPARRQCGDIDLWVSGERKAITKWIKSQCASGHSEWHHLEAGFFSDVSVEVHFHPAWLYNPVHNRKLQQFFWQKRDDAMMKRSEGFNYPSPGFDVVFSLVHTFHHLLEEGVGGRHIVDYFYILKALPQEERYNSLKIIRELGIEKFLSAMMWELKEVCGMPPEFMLCEPNETEGKFLLKEIMAGGNFGKARSDGLKRNSFNRYRVMVRHYPSEVLWMIPWKVWHKCWRIFYK